MSWDGIYRAKTHYAPRADGVWGKPACNRRFVRNKTDKRTLKAITCFGCLKALGLIK